MKRLSIILLCVLAGAVQAQVLSNPDQATINRLGLVFAPVQPAASDSGTTVSARVTVSPLQPDAVVARFGGVLESWTVSPGDEVKKGDLLGTIRSEAVLELQRDWVEANGALVQATLARTRDQRLFDDGVIAAVRLQQVQQDYRAAQARVNALAAQMSLAGITATPSRDSDSSQYVMRDYTLLAPVDGVVGRLEAVVGQAVAVDQPLVRLGAATLWLEADLPATLANDLSVGQPLRMQGVATPLTLRQLDRQVDARTQTIGIRAEFDGPVNLRAGAIVPLVLSPTQAGWRVPADAVVHNADTTEVFVRTAAGIESRVLELQPLGSDYLATDGLAAGDQLVVRGAALLKGVTLGLGGE